MKAKTFFGFVLIVLAIAGLGFIFTETSKCASRAIAKFHAKAESEQPKRWCVTYYAPNELVQSWVVTNRPSTFYNQIGFDLPDGQNIRVCGNWKLEEIK